MSVTTAEALQKARDANDSDAVAELEALLQYESEIDVAPYFFDHSNTKPPEQPAFVGMVDTVGDAIGGFVNPTTVGILAGAANPAYNALTKERGITLPAEEGEKKGKKITGDEARKRLSDAQEKGQSEFEKQRNLDADNLQRKVDIQTAELEPRADNLKVEINQFDNAIAQTNALTSQALSLGDTTGADINRNYAQMLADSRDQKINELNILTSQISELKEGVTNARNKQMSAAQAIDIDSQALKSMGIEPPDVTKELEAGDIDGARKKMSDLLEKNLQSKTAWMKSAVDYMKKNPGKAIPRALGKATKATFTGDTGKKALVSGLAGGLLTNIAMGTYDAMTGDYLSEEEATAERQKFVELGRLAEQYRNPSRGENTMYLNPLVPEQKQVIDQLQQAQSDPNRSYLLYKANLPYEARQLPSN